VFHFGAVPDPVRALFAKRRSLAVPLDPAACARLRHLATRAAEHVRRPGLLSVLGQQHLLLELCLLVAAAPAGTGGSFADLRADRTVNRALDWFGERLAEPEAGLVGMARAAGTSPAHLRRLFHDALGCSPREAMARVRFQRVMDLLWDRSLTSEVIAERCGFGSASALSRAFKQRFGYGPAEWRRGLGGGQGAARSRGLSPAGSGG